MRLIHIIIAVVTIILLLNCKEDSDILISSYLHNHSNKISNWQSLGQKSISFKKLRDGVFIYNGDTLDMGKSTFNFQGDQRCNLAMPKDEIELNQNFNVFRYVCNKKGFSDAEGLFFISKKEGLLLIWSSENVILYDREKNEALQDYILSNKSWLKADYIPPPPSPM